jgi:tRNA G18 (ribose-2'-O)-methylase SpoU
MSRLDGIKYNVHTCFQKEPSEKLTQISQKLSVNAAIMMLNNDGNMNIAMTVRSAAVLGFSDVYIVGKRSYDARPEVGAKHYIAVHKFDKVDESFFDAHNLIPMLVEQGGTPVEEFNFKPYMGKKVCFVVGSESQGIPDDILKMHFPRITISQYGMVRSLNVSVASSIVMYEYLRQWRQSMSHLL